MENNELRYYVLTEIYYKYSKKVFKIIYSSHFLFINIVLLSIFSHISLNIIDKLIIASVFLLGSLIVFKTLQKKFLKRKLLEFDNNILLRLSHESLLLYQVNKVGSFNEIKIKDIKIFKKVQNTFVLVSSKNFIIMIPEHALQDKTFQNSWVVFYKKLLDQYKKKIRALSLFNIICLFLWSVSFLLMSYFFSLLVSIAFYSCTIFQSFISKNIFIIIQKVISIFLVFISVYFTIIIIINYLIMFFLQL